MLNWPLFFSFCSQGLLKSTQFFLLVLIFASLRLFLFPGQCLTAPLTVYPAFLLLISEFLRLFYHRINLLPFSLWWTNHRDNCLIAWGEGGGKIQVSIYPLGKNQVVKSIF